MVLPIWWVGSRLTQSYMEKWIFCCLEVSVGISLRLMQSWEWIWICGIVLGYIDMFQCVLGAQWGSGVSLMAHSMRDPSSLVRDKPTNLAKPWKARLFSPDSLETSKYQNLPMYHSQKWLDFAVFCDFDTCQKEITIHSLFGSKTPFSVPLKCNFAEIICNWAFLT